MSEANHVRDVPKLVMIAACPFCGYSGQWEGKGAWRIVCTNVTCGAAGPSGSFQAEALIGWNTRTTPSQGLDAATVERLTRIRTSMALLQQNSEGCALNHYGSDAETHGLPGWLADTKRDLEALTDLIATEPHQHGAGNGEKHGG